MAETKTKDKNKKVYNLTRSDFAENFFYLKGQKFSLDHYPFMRRIYNSSADKIALKCSRQVGKSTTLANVMLANTCMSTDLRQLYVAPSVAQTQEFSRDKIEPVIRQSPFMRKYMLDSKLVQNVHKKEFANRSTIDLKYALLDADGIRGISSDMNYFDECYLPNMEVLSKSGWKDFKDLKLSDSLATVDEEGYLEYQKPSRIIEKEYDGVVYDFEHQSSKLSVTAGHNLYISQELNTGYYKDPKMKGWNLITAEDAEDMNFKMSSVAKIKNLFAPDTITIPGFKTKIAASTGDEYKSGKYKNFDSESYPSKSFMKFLGWYLAEGHYSKNQRSVCISQNEGKDADEIRDVLSQMGVTWRENTHTKDSGKTLIQFWVNKPALWNYLSELGSSYDKYIPNEILFNYSKYLPDLLKTLYKGDAIRRPGTCNPLGELKTASKNLADTVQLAWMILGKRASIRTSKSGIRRGYNHLHYIIRPLQYNYQIFWNSKNRVSKRNYKGKVYCATVPNGTLVVRDKDQKGIFVSGNCQDLRKDVIGVVEETMANSYIKKSMYVGTPKRTKGTLADYWFGSTQNEYALKCEACNHWNILNEENIGLSGLVCARCNNPLNSKTAKGEWVSTYSNPNKKPKIEGYRICRLHFAHSPWVDWEKDIIYKMENQSKALFYNETLGLEYDAGSIPITKEQLIKACNSEFRMTGEPDKHAKGRRSIMGIDYGPVGSDSSNTVITVLQERQGKLQVVYAKKFLGKEASYAYIHREIPKLMKKWNCVHLAADYGMGEAPNSEFRSRMGNDKVIAYQHLQTQKEKIRWNPKMPAYTLNRNQIMNQFFQWLKKGKIRLPHWEDIHEIAHDIRNVVVEYDEDKNKTKYVNVGPDDFVHSTIFAMTSAMMVYGLGDTAV